KKSGASAVVSRAIVQAPHVRPILNRQSMPHPSVRANWLANEQEGPMKSFPTRTTCVLILAAAFASAAQDAEKLTASTIANAIEARSAKEPAVWYAKFEIEHEGPAHLFDLPEADYGQRYRYQCIEEWWTD